MFNGHGNPETIYGHDNEELVKAGNNEDILRSLIVYTIACNSAQILGLKAVKKGAIAYIGYKNKFAFSYSQNMVSRPIKDRRAKPFFEGSNLVVESLLKGNTVDESVSKSKNFFIREYKKRMSSEATKDDVFDASILKWNMKGQIYHGEGNAVLNK